jgi:hypothetical protein
MRADVIADRPLELGHVLAEVGDFPVFQDFAELRCHVIEVGQVGSYEGNVPARHHCGHMQFWSVARARPARSPALA